MKRNMLRVGLWVLAIHSVIGISIFFGSTAATLGQTDAEDNTGAKEIVAQGKLFCILKRDVRLPYKGVITAVAVAPGQMVQTGDLLVEYRLDPEEALRLRRRLSRVQLNELEIKILELKEELNELRLKESELKALEGLKLAPDQRLSKINRQLDLVSDKIRHLQERLNREERLAREDYQLIAKQLDSETGRVPAVARVRAEMGGHVVLINPGLRSEAEISRNASVMQIGRMDPLVMRVQIHEIEAVQLHAGDKAEMTLESLPGKTFMATVERIPLTPLPVSHDQPSYYEFELLVPNPDFILREGLKGRIVFRK